MPSLFLCVLSSTTIHALADQANNGVTLGEMGSAKILMAEKNVLVVQKNGADPAQKAPSGIPPEKSPTPSDMIRFNQCCRPFFTADYLLWTAREDNMGYAFPFSNVFSENPLVKSKIAHPDWEWSSGFRVGAGLNFKYDGWDTCLNYTWFHPENSKDSISSKNPEISLFPAWDIFLGVSPLSNAKTRWKLKFDTLDWELGRNFFISRSLALRPFAGLKTLWMQQKHKIAFESSSDSSSMKNHLDSWGIGIRLGVDSIWYLYQKNLSIVADVALSALWTCYEISQKQHVSEIGTLFYAKDSYHSIKPVIEGMLGMQWESWFCNDAHKFSLRAAWEEQVWINQNQLPELLHIGPSFKARGGDLFLQGLTLRARVDF